MVTDDDYDTLQISKKLVKLIRVKKVRCLSFILVRNYDYDVALLE